MLLEKLIIGKICDIIYLYTTYTSFKHSFLYYRKYKMLHAMQFVLLFDILKVTFEKLKSNPVFAQYFFCTGEILCHLNLTSCWWQNDVKYKIFCGPFADKVWTEKIFIFDTLATTYQQCCKKKSKPHCKMINKCWIGPYKHINIKRRILLNTTFSQRIERNESLNKIIEFCLG